MVTIFERSPLTAGQLRTVADRRFEDARYLLESGKNKHANGAMYLAGFVIECCLKARLLGKRPELARENARAGEEARKLRRLLFGHDLERLVAASPEIGRQMVQNLPRGEAQRLADALRQVCAWTVFARYSGRQETLGRATLFVGMVSELRPWL